MHMKKLCSVIGTLLVIGSVSLATAATFTSPGGVTFINGNGITPAGTYPSTINVSGLSGTISSLTVTLTGLTHPRPDDIDILLVGPNGGKMVIMSDVGGVNALNNVTLTLDDSAASLMPDSGQISSGSYKPSNVDSTVADTFAAPAPAGPYSLSAPAGSATLGTVFAGASPNGAWSLYIVDDAAGPTGQSASLTSWSVNITTTTATAATTTTVTSAPATQAYVGDLVTLTASVTSSATVNSGSILFKDNGVGIGANVGVNTSGQATITTAGLAQGTHLITAQYNGATGFGASSGTTTLTIDNHTTQSAGNTFANSGAITINDAAPASVYPSRIFVTGLSGTLSKVTVQLKALNHPRPDDLDFLLVGPHGEKFVVLSDVGGTTAASGLNLTLDDSAAALAPDSAALGSSTYKPTDVDTADTFPAPAPAAPYNCPAPAGIATLTNTFAGTDPNGTWSLYIVDGTAGPSGQVASLASGWALTFTTSSDAPTTTAVTSSSPANHSATGDSVTFTAAVTKTATGTAATAGTVTFSEGTNILTGPIALNGSGQATFTTTTLSEGSHLITASYSGNPGTFNLSGGSLTQSIDTPTTVVGNTFANPGAIAFSDSGPASVYPSHIVVTNNGKASHVTLQLKGLTHPRLDNLDILLVSPSGAAFAVLSDVGGVNPASSLNLTLDDTANTALPNLTEVASGTYKPTAFNTDSDFWPLPAPAAPAFAAPFGTSTFASAFNGTDIAGTWSLYIVDDTAGPTGVANGSLAAGWSLTFTAPLILSVSTNVIAISETDQCGALVSFSAAASGLPAPTLTYQIGNTVITSPYLFPGGLTTVTCIAHNGAEADKTDTFTVNVLDTQAPVVSAPDLFLVIPSDSTSTNVAYTLTATDNCGVVSNWCVPPSGSAFLPGTTKVACTVYDAAGNTGSCSFTVDVDRQPIAGSHFLGTSANRPLTIPVTKLLANDSDPDNDPLSLALSTFTTSKGGAVSLLANSVFYQPPSEFAGLDQFVYDLADGRGGVTQATVLIDVVSTNSPDFHHLSISLSSSQVPQVNLSLLGIPTWTYTIQTAPEVTGPWTDVEPAILAGPDGLMHFSDTTVTGSDVRFYRFVSTP